MASLLTNECRSAALEALGLTIRPGIGYSAWFDALPGGSPRGDGTTEDKAVRDLCARVFGSLDKWWPHIAEILGLPTEAPTYYMRCMRCGEKHDG